MHRPGEARRGWFELIGVPVTVTARAWLFAPTKLLLGMLVGWGLHSQEPPAVWLSYGLVYGVLFLVVQPLHLLGHILSSRLVLPPMSEARVTPLVILTLYHNDPPGLSGRVHVLRSLGGPLMNILVGSVSLLLGLWTQSEVALIFALANYGIGFGALLPLPMIDGGVIWREVGRAIRRS